MTYFYAQLFAMDTEIRAMFPAAMDVQRRRFFEAMGRIADAQQSQAGRDHLVPYLQELGRAHRKFGVRERHYEVFRRALLATLQRFAWVLRERGAPDRLIHYDLDPKASQGL
jgi:hemoglobin-like flavoprotein